MYVYIYICLDDPQVTLFVLQLLPIWTRFFKVDNMLTGPGQTMLGKNASSSLALQESASLQDQNNKASICCMASEEAPRNLSIATTGLSQKERVPKIKHTYTNHLKVLDSTQEICDLGEFRPFPGFFRSFPGQFRPFHLNKNTKICRFPSFEL